LIGWSRWTRWRFHFEPAPLTALSAVIEGTEHAHLFKKEQAEIWGQNVSPQHSTQAQTKLHDEYFKRLPNPQLGTGRADRDRG
jgi:hypothetical protein